MTNKNKLRGDTLEREVVNKMRSEGFTCVRTLERGARPDGSDTWDIDLYPDPQGAAMIGECKRKKTGFKFIYDSLGKNDFLVIKQDRQERLYIVPEDVFIRMLK